MPDRQLIDILSWRYASELMRRHPGRFKTILSSRGGGQYDCITFVHINQPDAFLNRGASLYAPNPLRQAQNQKIPQEVLWEISDQADAVKRVADQISETIGVLVPDNLPPTRRESPLYRFIAEVLTHSAFSRHRWRCVNPIVDTSGYGSGIREAFFARFPATAAELDVRLDSDMLGQPAYRFWFLARNDEPQVCLETRGFLYSDDGENQDLMPAFRKHRRVWPLIWQYAGHTLL